ncbi:MAG TPA: ABC transporter ATPase, partial [candidate division Zixibacteria bacterium]|nr:ABC transporter ATPase [candidate division Zixibacteria bacterium]
MKSYRDLKDSARVWVYQAARPISDAECDEIRDRGKDFVASWAAHGQMLDAAVEVFHGRFVILFADEQQAKASGCSIDRSVGFIRELEGDLGISLLDWRTVVYRDGKNIVSTSREEFEQKLSAGRIGP